MSVNVSISCLSCNINVSGNDTTNRVKVSHSIIYDVNDGYVEFMLLDGILITIDGETYKVKEDGDI